MLQRDIQIRQNFTFRHQRNHVIDVRVRVDVVQTDPDTQFRQLFAQADHAGFNRRAVVKAGAMLHIDAVGGGILRDNQQLFDAGIGQAFGFGQHFTNRTADKVAAHRRDNAEGAAMVTAFGNFQVGVMTWRELHALFRHQAQERVVFRLRRIVMDMLQNLFIAVRPGYLQHFRMHFANLVFFRAQAAGHNNFAIFF